MPIKHTKPRASGGIHSIRDRVFAEVLGNLEASGEAMLSRAPTTITFSNEAMKANLLRLQNEWEAYQSNHERDAVYGYLAAVFELVEWWDQEGKAGNRACRALHLRGHKSVREPEPFAAVILCTADHAEEQMVAGLTVRRGIQKPR
jgi:hypothetical protein